MSYNHLTIEERACIAVYYKEKKKISEIAKLLDRNKSTISRELKRNPSCNEGYNAIGAQRKYRARRKKCVQKLILQKDQKLFEMVCTGLNNYWSPEQICNTLPKGKKISFSTLYRALTKNVIPKEFCVKLRRYGKRLKRNRSNGKTYDFSIVRPISDRPNTVENRNRYGHWELDTIVLRPECKCHLATFVERKSRLLLIRRIPDKKAATMSDAIISALGSLPDKFRKTLTVDRGMEFTDWQRVEQELGVIVYFCDPYSPWQRGSNENTNGLVRQFFPRRSILPPVTHQFVDFVQFLINHRPRKCLNWLSPSQLLHLA